MGMKMSQNAYIGSAPGSCSLTGNTDTYGIGIRVSFYLEWYGIVVAAYLSEDRVNDMRLAQILLSAATFLATIIDVAQGNQDPIETYIVLLLNFGSSYYLIPVFIWRFATNFTAEWDPTRFPKPDPPTWALTVGYTLLLVAVAIFQIWFWAAQEGFTDPDHCRREGFLFGRGNDLSTPWFRIFNLVLSVLLLAIMFAVLWMTVDTVREKVKTNQDGQSDVKRRERVVTSSAKRHNGEGLGSTSSDRNQKPGNDDIVGSEHEVRKAIEEDSPTSPSSDNGKRKRKEIDWTLPENQKRAKQLQNIDSVLRIAVNSIVVAAVEYTISINDIQGVNDMASAGQLIALFLAVSVYIGIFWDFGYEKYEKYKAIKNKKAQEPERSKPEDPELKDPEPCSTCGSKPADNEIQESPKELPTTILPVSRNHIIIANGGLHVGRTA